MKIGKLGLEKRLENHLIGTNAIQRYEVNAYGKRINQLEHQKGEQGSKIRLTVDTEIQKACGELLNEKAGSISVMDIYTGDISAVLLKNLPFWSRVYRTPSIDIALNPEWENKIDTMAAVTSKQNITSISGVPTWLSLIHI